MSESKLGNSSGLSFELNNSICTQIFTPSYIRYKLDLTTVPILSYAMIIILQYTPI